MNTPPLVEKAETYLNLQLTHLGHVTAPDSAPPFVTLCRESGCGGLAIAGLLARELPAPADRSWTVYSRNLIERMLATNDLLPYVARYLPEDRVSEVDASVGEIVGLHPNLWTLVRKANELMRDLARGGYAILLGRGANFATAGLTNGIHVRLVAPRSFRAARMAERRGISPREAAEYNAARDAARQRYTRANFGADATAPDAYDVVINVAQLPVSGVVRMIAELVAARTGGVGAHLSATSA